MSDDWGGALAEMDGFGVVDVRGDRSLVVDADLDSFDSGSVDVDVVVSVVVVVVRSDMATTP